MIGIRVRVWFAVVYTVVASLAIAEDLPSYERVSGVSGNLSSVGSDTLANLMTLWAEAFEKEYPNVNIQVQAAGSSTAPPALTEGVSNFGPMSRKMKDKEIEAFEKRYGYKPLGVRVAIDALAIYVHKDNPLESLTIQQVDAIFSTTRRCGGTRNVRTWGDLGLDGTWVNRPLQLYGRNSVSGTYGYFKQVGLCSGDFKNTVNEQPGSASVVQSVTASLNGIGYSGVGYVTSGVRAIPIAEDSAMPPVKVTTETALDGSYPLRRYLYIYVNKKPDTPLYPLEYEFLRLVLSETGQEVVDKDGYVPLSARMVNRELKRLTN
ncbi:MAG: phosphate ABC transporter substrate-binding protein PstS family protein [Gammaproteobacteria bacterium]|nr:phosphate ABC transporter substrate-binding protein PstS family protein [Gammaproteobacteria bacterium]